MIDQTRPLPEQVKLPKSYEDYWTRKFGLTPDEFKVEKQAGRLSGLPKNYYGQKPDRSSQLDRHQGGSRDVSLLKLKIPAFAGMPNEKNRSQGGDKR